MTPSRCKHQCQWIDRFTLPEKMIGRIGFFGTFAIGAVSILLENILLGLGYAIFVIVGLSLMVKRLFCVYCPYPTQYSDCLFFPIWFIGKNPNPDKNAMDKGDRIATFILLGLLIVLPQYWLIKRSIFIILFWVFNIYTICRAYYYLCRRCRYVRCPLNQACE